jgi:hypothetical protein
MEQVNLKRIHTGYFQILSHIKLLWLDNNYVKAFKVKILIFSFMKIYMNMNMNMSNRI